MFLNCHSYYSLRYGTLSIEQLTEAIKNTGVESVALTDINNTTAAIDFVRICNKLNIKPISGIEFREKGKLLYIGISRNIEGFRELNEFLTEHNLSEEKLPQIAPVFKNSYIIYPSDYKVITKLKDNEFIGIRPSEINSLFNSSLRSSLNKLIALHSVTFLNREGYILHQHLRAIDNNLLLSQLQAKHLALPDEIPVPIWQIKNAYSAYPQIITNTQTLLDDCCISFDFKSHKNKQTFTDSRYGDKLLLRKLALEGLEYRYGKNNQDAQARIEKELEIIDKLGFSAYFLIACDIISYSMSQGIYHVGRGSGANSIVAYCLKITDVDPIELNLYFERFLNPKRTSPPDFDIDYSWRDRDQVQQYIFDRYGKEHTALLGAMSTFKGKSIIRELAKVYGLPKEEVDEFILHPDKPENNNEITRKVMAVGSLMEDFPNIRSIHAGGILISEKPLSYYTALDLPPKGFPTTQWDMYVAEDIGFEKLDILSQRGIGHIKDSVDIVKQNQGLDIDIHQVEKFKTDHQVKYQLRIGETTGCFYIESPAMRGLLKKLKCDNYITLVAASSIIRPGVAKSGMMREYIQRFHNPDKFEYLHPIMKEQLEETFGVMVYQEDVIKICHYFAGLDLADADVLRRAMSGKYRSRVEFEKIVEKFFVNCKQLGYPDSLTKEVWRQIESFAGYSFSKAHSASYAVESYQSLYLKAHFPLEFMVAVINNFGGFYSGWVYFNEAKRWGATINLPCVNKSTYKTTIYGNKIYIGFIHISNFENQIGQAIETERIKNGAFCDLADFINRISIGLENLLIIIKLGAFRFTGKSKATLLWEAHSLLKKGKEPPTMRHLFPVTTKKFELPKLEYNILEDAYDEIELLGFPVSISFFDMLQTKFRGEIFANQMINYVGKKVRMVGHWVTQKYVRTVKKEIMYFGTFLDNKGEFFDSVHFPNTLKEYPLLGNGVYLLLGIVTQEFGFPSLTVEKAAKLPLKPDPRYA